MRPGVAYNDAAADEKETSNGANSLQYVSVQIDTQIFHGSGHSKKQARREAAANACNSLFGTNFELANDNNWYEGV